MIACWNEKPEERPSFTDLRKTMKVMGDEREVKPILVFIKDRMHL